MCDKLIGKRPGYAGWAVATAAVVVTAILVPIITGWWAKKYGCPQFPLEKNAKCNDN